MTVHPLNGASTGSVTKVLGPTEGTDYAGGVGSAQVLYAEPYGTKLLFTGWPNPPADDRHLFIADINNALEVSNVQKIVDATSFGRVDAAYGFYDADADRWLIGAGKSDGGRSIGLLEFAGDFSSYNFYDFGKSPKDCGANAITNQTGNLWLSWVSSSSGDLSVGKVTADYTTESFGGFPSTFSGQKIVQASSEYHALDVNNILYGVSGLTILGEYFDANQEQWALRPSFIGSTDIGAFNNIALTSTKPLLQSSLQGGGDNYGHPHFTTQLGRPLLFFSWFRDVTSGRNTHEIWAMEPEYNVTNPQDWLPLRGRILKNGSGPSDIFHTHGAEKAVLWIDAGSNTGDVLVREAMSSAVVNSGAHVETSYSASTGRNKIVIDDPMYAVELATDFNTNGVDVMLR